MSDTPFDLRNPSAELYDKNAEQFAGMFRKPESSQLRRFYDELVRLETQARQQPEKWEEIKPLVKMLNAQVAYAHGRQHVDEVFYNAFVELIRQIESLEHLTRCKHFLEATIGFRKLKEAQAKSRR
ncbi:type III-A CRISPR-associated protein Csm2 [Halomonas campisalis]|uniref:CRISPR system Cms protein Csm2 n=1 Tax=Billgrantia campisalis TaxID=74661 RepID=A0ABS9PCB3_9GAMM|nr:type III-A CRISPR-associated protein Csm2 [Halomonas campisalis]MCG6659397.1 type III-A CRISPR-associated protein Csm2 [Halomonas campisalis]MDR5863999.1 type III-A CRISPR-associated protein Csm2 [Halomonas campisalis]